MLYIILLIGIGFIFGFEKMIAILSTLFFIYIFFTLFGILFSILPVLIVIGLIYYFLNKDKINFKYNSYKSFFNNFESNESNFYYKWGNTNSQNNSYEKNSYSNFNNQSKDYYSILGLDRNSSEDEIKKRYKELVKKYHPDIHNNKSEAEKTSYEEKFKEIQSAYENIKKEKNF